MSNSEKLKAFQEASPFNEPSNYRIIKLTEDGNYIVLDLQKKESNYIYLFEGEKMIAQYGVKYSSLGIDPTWRHSEETRKWIQHFVDKYTIYAYKTDTLFEEFLKKNSGGTYSGIWIGELGATRKDKIYSLDTWEMRLDRDDPGVKIRDISPIITELVKKGNDVRFDVCNVREKDVIDLYLTNCVEGRDIILKVKILEGFEFWPGG